MEETKRLNMIEQEEAEANVEIWNYVFGFVAMAVVKCAIELQIADVLETQDSPMTLSDLSSAIGCKPSLLYRIMRFLIHRNIFREVTRGDASKGYVQTPLSRRLLKEGDKSLAAFVLMMSSPEMLGPLLSLRRGVIAVDETSPFEAANGDDVWSYAASNPGLNKHINESTSCEARISVPAFIKGCPDVLDGVSTLVDVGGRFGTSLRILVKEFPWIRGINFDQPHVIAEAPEINGIEHVGGNMFENVPKADAAFLKWVLHDWGDEDAIQILKKCREALPENKGKVIILDAILDEEHDREDKLMGVRLMLDMAVLAYTKSGKQRTLADWKYVLGQAGFSSYTVKTIQALQSVIVAFP